MSKKSSAARKSRVATSFQVQFEPLEGRRYFSAVVQQFSFPTASAGAAVAPFIQDNLGSNPHGEQLVATAISPVDGTLAVLVQVQSFDGPTPPTATSLRLYMSSNGGGAWFKNDVNTSFDGQLDYYAPDHAYRSRFDEAMEFDPSGRLWILYQSAASSLALDRIPAALVATMASGGQLPLWTDTSGGGLPARILPPDDVCAFGTGNLRPQLAVGADPNLTGGTIAYVQIGEVGASPALWAWDGAGDNSIQRIGNSHWKNLQQCDLGASWNPMTVAGDGRLYAATGSEIDSIGPTLSDRAYALPNPTTTGTLIASGMTLYCLTNYGGGLRVATAPVPAAGASGAPGAWSYSLPLSGSVFQSVLSVDPLDGKACVGYTTTAFTAGSDTTVRVATELDGVWVSDQPVAAVVGIYPAVSQQNDHVVPLSCAVSGTSAVFAWSAVGPAQVSGASVVYAAPVTLSPTTGSELVVTNDGGAATDQIALSGDVGTGALAVTINGVAQTFSGAIQKIVVNGINGPSLTVDQTSGNPIPAYGLVFNSTGAAGTLTVNTASNPELLGSSLSLGGALISARTGTAIRLNLEGSNQTVTSVHPTGGPVNVAGASGTYFIVAAFD